jgi:hypothetical protein
MDNVKLKVIKKMGGLDITEANMSVEEILFLIHKLIDSISKHTGIPLDEVYRDILGENNDSNS